MSICIVFANLVAIDCTSKNVLYCPPQCDFLVARKYLSQMSFKNAVLYFLQRGLRRLEEHPLGIKHILGLYFLLPLASALSKSDASNDGVEPASGLVIQNRQTYYFSRCPMYGAL